MAYQILPTSLDFRQFFFKFVGFLFSPRKHKGPECYGGDSVSTGCLFSLVRLKNGIIEEQLSLGVMYSVM